MVVENIDTVSTEYRKLSSLRFNKTVPISPIEYLKKATDQPSNSPHSSKSNTIISVQVSRPSHVIRRMLHTSIRLSTLRITFFLFIEKRFIPFE